MKDITKKIASQKLKELGPTLLKKHYQEKWSKNRPTTGYCYLLSEVIYHYLYPNAKSYVINLGDQGTHWFLKTPDGQIIDWTYDQFDFQVPYSKARGAAFFLGKHKTKRGYISKNGKLLAKYLGVIK